ncbi:hypothetical protein LIER_12624 [Lithospermum erythrorhizon]|uniref:Uncharacterized protein n=1 Tax=Lithospermum erythrorhizon TaxID=34254 RepID=A0AAV3PXN2_LITER
MSRCFAYPPPGYSVSQGSGPALIESIKLQRGSLLAKAEAKKDRKKDKKGRSKEKKEKSKESLLPEKKIHKRSSSGRKIRSLQKLIQSENEQLESSSLTEERVQPIGEQKPSTSSDSTQNSSKRKREVASSQSAVRHEEHSIRSSGNVVRIRLPLKRQNALVSKQEPCSTTSQKTELPSHEQATSQRTELPSHGQTTSRRTELPSHERKAISISREPCYTSGRSALATSNNHLECQVHFPSVQQGHDNVICLRPPRCEDDKVGCLSVPKSVNREDTPAVVSQLPEKKLSNVAFPPLRPPKHEVDNVSSASGPKSHDREDTAAVVSQLLGIKLPNVALPPRPDEKICSTSGIPKAITREDDIFRHPKSLDKKMLKAELKYRDLFLNWVPPPPPQTELESDDQDWLFSKKKNPDNQTEKKLKPNSSMSRCSHSSLWPRAQFIPEADIYALPFTVPF